MLATACKSSNQGHLPITPESPVRAIIQLLRDLQPRAETRNCDIQLGTIAEEDGSINDETTPADKNTYKNDSPFQTGDRTIPNSTREKKLEETVKKLTKQVTMLKEHTQEKKGCREGDNVKLNGDGMPRLLTSDKVFEQVLVYQERQQAKAAEKETRKAARMV
ncbi:hypothetical protein BDR06DRAFT_971313 [Suillus hirtellus]|nr:hypothetical protein BDR06DRAFT_971313 [Suillus hirtellus]